MGKDTSFVETLALREQYRDWYLEHRDPIAEGVQVQRSSARSENSHQWSIDCILRAERH